ncbi:hypothetical protein ABE073_04860 [Lederbergia citrisecunda]|uniref:hypothetical protein n=1 Tax=Lederbergia citrisecunda TaxID=2833583 RepID=UPI003D2DA1AD
MFIEGSIAIPKPVGYLELGLSTKYKRFRVVYAESNYGKIESLDREASYTGTMDFSKYFYNPAHVNMEIMNLLESGTEIKSFNAVTVDGKIIQIESTQL